MARTPGREHEGRTYGGLSPAERTERRREALLEAGLEIFGTAGFRTATVRGVCAEAGVATRYFYESFDSMEALLGAVFERCLDDLRARLVSTFDEPGVAADPEAMVMAGLDCFFRWVEEPRVARVCWREVLGVSPRVDALWKQGMQGFEPMLVELTRGFYPAWEIDEREFDALAVAATGALSQAALRWHLDGHRVPRETMIAATARVLLGIRMTIEADLAGEK